MIDWLYRHYALTGTIIAYYLALIGYGTCQLFGDVPGITGAAAEAYLGLMGLPAAVAVILKWRFKRDNQ